MYPFIRTSASYRVFHRRPGEIRYSPLSDVSIDSISPADNGGFSISVTSANPFFRHMLSSGSEFDLLAVSGDGNAVAYADAENGTAMYGLRIDSIGASSLATAGDQNAVVRRQIAIAASSVVDFSKMTVVGMPDLGSYCDYAAGVVETRDHTFVLAISVSTSLSVSVLTRSPSGAWKKNTLDIDDLAAPTNARLWPFKIATSGAFLVITVDVDMTNASPNGRQNVVLVPIQALIRANDGTEVKVSSILSIGQTPRCTYLCCDEDDGLMVFSDGSAYSIPRGGLPIAEPSLFSGSGSTIGTRDGDAWILATSSSAYSAHVVHIFRRGRWTHRTAYGLGVSPIMSIGMRNDLITLTQGDGVVFAASALSCDFVQAGTSPISNVLQLGAGAGVSYQCSGSSLYRSLDALSVGSEGLAIGGTSPGTPRYVALGPPVRRQGGLLVCGSISPRQNIYGYAAAAELFSSARPILMEVEC